MPLSDVIVIVQEQVESIEVLDVNDVDNVVVSGDAFTVDTISIAEIGAIYGPQGEIGPQGIQGPQGEQGIQGEAGIAGNVISAVGISIHASNFITVGNKGYIEVPYSCEIQEVTLLGTTAGSIVIDIWKTNYASYPPTIADSITAATPPTLNNEISSKDAALTGWNTTIQAGDVLSFYVQSVSGLTQVTCTLKVMKTI